MDDNDSGELPVEIQQEVRNAALATIIEFRAGRLVPVTPLGAWRRQRPDGAEVLAVRVLISAVGMVNRPSVPDLPGWTSSGPVLHTAVWDPSVQLTGTKVAVIGTGASAMQLVPSIVDDADHVTAFQRSKPWAVLHPNYQRDVPRP